ncbi:MAG: hypothetical protein GY856_04540 [bacterium]|nr:hypothetical protein [bacterium]
MRRCAMLIVMLAVIVIGCGPHTATESRMLDWGNALNLHLATGVGGDYAFPKALDEVRAELSTADGWGNEFFYRRIRDDRYQLISAGADGELGNDDDIVLENSAFYEAAKVYAKNPLKKGRKRRR